MSPLNPLATFRALQAPLGFRIIESKFVGELVVPQKPRPWRVKKFKQRRLKQWQRKHPPYYRANGQYLISGNTIVCHPDDARELRRVVERKALTVSTAAGSSIRSRDNQI